MAPRAEHERHDNGGAGAAANIRRAALWLSPIIIATSLVVSDRVNDQRDSSETKREIRDIWERLVRIERDLADRLQFVDRDGIRDPVVRMAIDRHVENILRLQKVLTQAWARRFQDHNPTVKLPEE